MVVTERTTAITTSPATMDSWVSLGSPVSTKTPSMGIRPKKVPATISVVGKISKQLGKAYLQGSLVA